MDVMTECHLGSVIHPHDNVVSRLPAELGLTRVTCLYHQTTRGGEAHTLHLAWLNVFKCEKPLYTGAHCCPDLLGALDILARTGGDT